MEHFVRANLLKHSDRGLNNNHKAKLCFLLFYPLWWESGFTFKEIGALLWTKWALYPKKKASNRWLSLSSIRCTPFIWMRFVSKAKSSCPLLARRGWRPSVPLRILECVAPFDLTPARNKLPLHWHHVPVVLCRPCLECAAEARASFCARKSDTRVSAFAPPQYPRLASISPCGCLLPACPFLYFSCARVCPSVRLSVPRAHALPHVCLAGWIFELVFKPPRFRVLPFSQLAKYLAVLWVRLCCGGHD